VIRITAGEFKGRKLKTPKGLSTRPSPARLREALFDVLGRAVEGCVFFDLFAGSGAVGLEALSRGAARAIFVECARDPIATIRENLTILGCADRANCLPHRLPGWFGSPAWTSFCRGEAPVVFFLDPPFQQDLALATMEALAQAVTQAPSQVLLAACAVQTEKKAVLPDAYGLWRLRKRYPHGDSALWFYDVEQE
jgi:16S rRNA (guanine(966)-N(2))-methyltransferase RsmD